MHSLTLSLSIHSSNLKSLSLIYNDSIIIRDTKKLELEEKLIKEQAWTNSEFNSFNHYDNHFDWLLLQALFISGFSYFEKFMKSAASHIEKLQLSNIQIKDLKAIGPLDTYRKYISLIGQIDSATEDSNIWKSILEFKTIRNAIIHNYGELNGEVSRAKVHDIYFGPSRKMIRIKKLAFIEDFVDTSITYMSTLTSEIQEKYPQ